MEIVALLQFAFDVLRVLIRKCHYMCAVYHELSPVQSLDSQSIESLFPVPLQFPLEEQIVRACIAQSSLHRIKSHSR